MGVDFITETQDNFRDPEHKNKLSKEDQIVNYLQNDNQKLIKKKMYNNLNDLDQMKTKNFTTEYREQVRKQNVLHDAES